MGIYIITRDVYKQADNGLWTKKVRREYLQETKSGRYVWQYDSQRFSEFTVEKSCAIMQNLQRVVRPKYTYLKQQRL